jgi:hypothetical protein
MPSTVRSKRHRPEERQREFVRRFVESVPLGEREVTSTPCTDLLTFILPLSASESGSPRQLALGIHLKKTSRFGELAEIFGKIALIKDGEVITSRSLRFKLLRLGKHLITRWDAFKILIDRHGPILEPVAWRVEVSRSAGFVHEQDASAVRPVSIEATGTWTHKIWADREKKYTVRLTTIIEAEPTPRAYLLVSIADRLSTIWTAHSQWASLAGRGLARYVKTALEGEDGEAGNRT